MCTISRHIYMYLGESFKVCVKVFLVHLDTINASNLHWIDSEDLVIMLFLVISKELSWQFTTCFLWERYNH